VDRAWVNVGGERQTSGLVILEEDSALITYDPAWVGAEGSPRITRSLLGTPPAGTPKAIASFGGKLYILDPDADQLWRYEPRGDVYPEQPDRYFVTPPPQPLEGALDVAIDGNIYILYSDGTILKFLGRELQPFDVSEIFDSESQVATLAIDVDGSSGMVYVADSGHGCVLALEPNGALRARFCAEQAFDAVEALVVDEAAQQLLAISGGRLYVASLP
jgi:outer membrane protein assembly factor BamB